MLLVLTVVIPLSNAAKTLPGHPGGWELGERREREMPHGWGVPWALPVGTARKPRHSRERQVYRRGDAQGRRRCWVGTDAVKESGLYYPRQRSTQPLPCSWHHGLCAVIGRALASSSLQGNGGSLPDGAALDGMLV